jgi:hypothetical protein
MQTPKKPDIGNLPNSAHMAGDEMVGVKTAGYLDKKGTPNGNSVEFNVLPPGLDIENQKVADIRDLPMKTVTRLGFPGDGWNG